ncbi:hypothetical protein SDJN03_17644, partial [Cucurbita argyrosperma subsp. sororia]
MRPIISNSIFTLATACEHLRELSAIHWNKVCEAFQGCATVRRIHCRPVNSQRSFTVSGRSSSNFPLNPRYFSSSLSAPEISPPLSSSRQNSISFLGFFGPANPNPNPPYWIVLRFLFSGCWLSNFCGLLDA